MPTRKIALLFEFATMNGGERSMLAAIDWIPTNSQEFGFVAIAPKDGRLAEELTDRGIPVADWTTHDRGGQRHPADLLQNTLVQIVAHAKPDLLHANSLAMGRLAGQVKHRVGIPTTAHLRDIIKLSAAAVADLNRNDRLIAVSNATREYHTGRGIDASRTTVVHNGVDLEQFRPRLPTGRLSDELHLSGGRGPFQHLASLTTAGLQEVNWAQDQFAARDIRPKLIATIGQIGLRKGQNVLAAAAPLIVNHVPDAHFVLIGERSSRKQESVEFEAAIHRAFDAAGLADRLHLLGYRNDVDLLFGDIDVLVHPAHQEPYGRVLLEASAAGVAIVATNVGGTSEIISDGVTGLLVPRGDPQALATAAVRILKDPKEACQLRAAARQRAIDHFSISTAAQNLASVWDDVFCP